MRDKGGVSEREREEGGMGEGGGGARKQRLIEQVTEKGR